VKDIDGRRNADTLECVALAEIRETENGTEMLNMKDKTLVRIQMASERSLQRPWSITGPVVLVLPVLQIIQFD
jgi:hypothetical protein